MGEIVAAVDHLSDTVSDIADTARNVANSAQNALALKRGASQVFYPDHVVFLGVGVATGFEGDPPLIAVPGAGVLIRMDAKPAVEAMGRCLADVMRRISEDDPLVALTDDDIDRLVNWDAEKYRQTLKV